MTRYCEATDYHQQADYFAKLPEYSIECGTDFLAVKDVPSIISKVQPLNKILDLGCGTGLATRYLKKHFPHCTVIGADINQTMLEQAKAADPHGIYLHLAKSDQGIHYSFLPNTFDVIICSFVLHENHSKQALESFLYHISTLLRPQGLFLAWDAYKHILKGKWLTIETTHPKSSDLNDGETYSLILHPSRAEVSGTYWSPEETVSKLAEANQLRQLQISYPTVENDTQITWRDETSLPPYYVLAAYKQGN